MWNKFCHASETYQKHLLQVFVTFQKYPTKIVSCDFRRVIKISDKIDVGPLKSSQQMKSFQVCVCVCMCVYEYVLFPFIVKAPSD